MRRAALLACALASWGCTHAPARGPRLATVTAEGWAPVEPLDALATKRRALAEALRAAVEKAAGVNVSGRTRVSSAVAVEQRITARVDGVVRSYEVTSESESGGFHKTCVRAAVELNPAPETPARPEPPAGDPKVAVVLRGPGSQSAAAGVKRGLIERGFSVIDGDQGDLVVSGEVSVAPIGMVGEWTSCRARVALEARQTKTGRLLWQQSREASALDLQPETAELKASELAGLQGAQLLAKQVAAILSD